MASKIIFGMLNDFYDYDNIGRSFWLWYNGCYTNELPFESDYQDIFINPIAKSFDKTIGENRTKTFINRVIQSHVWTDDQKRTMFEELYRYVITCYYLKSISVLFKTAALIYESKNKNCNQIKSTRNLNDFIKIIESYRGYINRLSLSCSIRDSGARYFYSATCLFNWSTALDVMVDTRMDLGDIEHVVISVTKYRISKTDDLIKSFFIPCLRKYINDNYEDRICHKLSMNAMLKHIKDFFIQKKQWYNYCSDIDNSLERKHMEQSIPLIIKMENIINDYFLLQLVES